MVKYKIKNLQTIVCLLFTLFCFSTAIIVLTIGGTFFSEQNPKALNYANSMCQVDSRSYKNYECKSHYYQYTCYGPIWNVHLGEHRDVLAVVETQLRYRSYSDALNEANKYQVRKYPSSNSLRRIITKFFSSLDWFIIFMLV
jgi:hypothetical protein